MLQCIRRKSQQRIISDNIDREIHKWHKEEGNTIKLLLLGTKESGKSTIIKQMKILHIEGFTPEEVQEKVEEIRLNIQEIIFDIANSMRLMENLAKFNSESSLRSAEFILDKNPDDPNTFSNEYCKHAMNLWNDLQVKEFCQNSTNYHLTDNAIHFLDRLEVIGQVGYQPSQHDMLFSKNKTTAITKLKFSVTMPGGTQKFEMFDVGNYKGERKKWIKVFSGIDAILFLISSSNFDEFTSNNCTKNRFQESLELFEDIWMSRFVRDTGFIVFLNKQDLLEEKIRNGVCFEKYFPDFSTFSFPSAPNEYEKVKEYMRQKLKEIENKKVEKNHLNMDSIENDSASNQCYVHFTTATDTDNVKRVFENVYLILFYRNLEKAGLI